MFNLLPHFLYIEIRIRVFICEMFDEEKEIGNATTTNNSLATYAYYVLFSVCVGITKPLFLASHQVS